MQDQFIEFVRCFSNRRTLIKKKAFTENISNLFAKLGYTYTITEEKVGLLKVRNVYIGEWKNADIIVAAGYDTGTDIHSSRNYYPTDAEYNRKTQYYDMLWNFFLGIGCLIVAFLLFLYNRGSTGWIFTVRTVIALGVGIFAVYFGRGSTNRTNFSKSASVFLLLQLAQKLEKKENIAFAFLDYASYSRIGIDCLGKSLLHPKKTQVLYLDSLAFGDNLLLQSSPSAKETAKQLEQLSSLKAIVWKDNDNARFSALQNWTILSLADEDKNGYYVPFARTGKDLTIDTEKYEQVLQTVCRFLKER